MITIRIEQGMKWAVSALALTTLVACGGGGSDTTTTPINNPVNSNTAASACLPTARFTSGYAETLNFTEVTALNGLPSTNQNGTSGLTLVGSATFNGVTAFKFSGTDSIDGNDNSYEALVDNKWLNYGTEFKAVNGVTVDRVDTFSPALIQFDASLATGVPSTPQTVTDSFAQPPGSLTPAVTTQTVTTQFVGRESVTVGLGTFTAACHARVTSNISGVVIVLDDWWTPSTGLSVKSIISTTLAGSTTPDSVITRTLNSGTVNGQAIVAN